MFLEQLIRQRNYMLRYHLNRRSEIEIIDAIDFIKKHLACNTYTDRQMASFLFRHKEKVQTLLPGVGSPQHLHYQEQYDLLMWEASLQDRQLVLQYQPIDFGHFPS